jgi:hypothetical protein
MTLIYLLKGSAGKLYSYIETKLLVWRPLATMVFWCERQKEGSGTERSNIMILIFILKGSADSDILIYFQRLTF